MVAPKFSRRIIETLSKRAAFRCSNPDCSVLTVGAKTKASGASIVGEAAHINGANRGSARFRPEMTDEERAFIENGIWLCRSCHKKVDDNPTYYTAELLIEWKAEHEGTTARDLGSRGTDVWRTARQKALHPYRDLSARAQETIADRPDYWEYKLILELLRGLSGPLIRRMKDVELGLYTTPGELIEGRKVPEWSSMKLAEISRFSEALFALINQELASAWGAPGEPGNVEEIIRVCRLIERVSAQVVEWEAEVRSASTPSEFTGLFHSLRGAGATLIEAVERLIEFFEGIFATANPEGRFVFDFEILLPPGWADQVNRAMHQCTAAYIAGLE
jgi:hypothetical protein